VREDSCRTCRTIAFWRRRGVSAVARGSRWRPLFSRWGPATAACPRHPRHESGSRAARRGAARGKRASRKRERGERKEGLPREREDQRSTLRMRADETCVRACVHTRARARAGAFFTRERHAGSGTVGRADCHGLSTRRPGRNVARNARADAGGPTLGTCSDGSCYLRRRSICFLGRPSYFCSSRASRARARPPRLLRKARPYLAINIHFYQCRLITLEQQSTYEKFKKNCFPDECNYE